MSHTLSQPEEVDLAILELDDMNRKSRTSGNNKMSGTQASPTLPNYGYVSPYRAAHIRAMQNRSSNSL